MELNTWRKLLQVFNAICLALMLATILGMFGNRPYILFVIGWVVCTVNFSQVRLRFPDVTETMIIFGWVILGSLGLAFILAFVFGQLYAR